jgi:uncharacterized DUF497 family protein
VGKHGVSFEEAATVFLDPLDGLDELHSRAESRFVVWANRSTAAC